MPEEADLTEWLSAFGEVEEIFRVSDGHSRSESEPEERGYLTALYIPSGQNFIYVYIYIYMYIHVYIYTYEQGSGMIVLKK